ncbi:putative RNA-binding Zn-ribbon protein involved in translation (DUF1610 family) [Paenibacillus anaericanus]|uniref:hypothetical protein n=1 Tax=Paenibacillus anaericanus TaxID=170367 RepID=UPI0027801E0E|nr:hypothetical protein [Paenibacillus anaericanus]MDQ0090711.1 putative RNA-binding Zn-ribbon protein involved in translation (DUF1610 family) [Paenibacillus anaericanus]
MSYICPLCNGLANLNSSCPDCGTVLENMGKKEDYAGPYSPYGSIDQFTSVIYKHAALGCEHVAQCPHCHEAYIYRVNAVQTP